MDQSQAKWHQAIYLYPIGRVLIKQGAAVHPIETKQSLLQLPFLNIELSSFRHLGLKLPH